MGHTNRVLIQRINPDYRDSLGYFPDTLFYKHDTIQYQQKIARLAEASYFYSDGYSLRTANIFRYLFESVKGWLGFSNHCQQEKVQLALRKFVYYGYLQGYSQPQAQLQNLGIDSDYLNLVSRPRTNENSQQIQNKLIQFYVENESNFEISTLNYLPQLSQYYTFGSILAHLGLETEIPIIDPQNEQLIAATIEELEPESGERQSYDFIPSSKFALGCANCYLERARKVKERYFYNWNLLTNHQADAHRFLKYALLFDPEITFREIDTYIEYYLEKKELTEAIALIHYLKDEERALGYIKKGNYNTHQLQLWVKKDSWLAKIVTAYYLNQQWNLDTIKFLVYLHSNFAELYPVQAFSLLVSQKKYEEAYTLFSTNKNAAFLTQSIADLADFFSEQGENLYELGHNYRESKEWKRAKEHYLKSASMKRRAKDLQPDSEARKNDYFEHTRLYAQLLIDADIELNSIEHCQIEEILKAIKLLRECSSTDDYEKIYHRKALAQGLMRQVDYLAHRVLIPLSYESDLEILEEHKKEHNSNFINLSKALNQIICLLEGTKDSELKLMLGKAYFLLADFCDFFDLKDYSPSYYSKAQETVPDNPFYLLRHSERFTQNKENYQNQGVNLLKQLGFTVMDYYKYDKERWYRDYRVAPIKDIHYSQNEDKILGLQLRS